MNQTDPGPRTVGSPARAASYRAYEAERDRRFRERTRNLLLLGIAVSLPIHIGIMIYLNLVRRAPGSSHPTPVAVEFAIVTEEELTDLDAQSEFDELTPETVADVSDPSVDLSEAVADIAPSAELDAAEPGSIGSLGGAGEGDGGMQSLGGGAAGTSFFGVSSRGTRFAYIVDVSGSMESMGKMYTAMEELKASVRALPDYAYFYVVLFSSAAVLPPGQERWTRARSRAVSSLSRWLDQLAPGGGTKPLPAFHEVYSLDVMPDVIFFMTDGQIPKTSADEVADLNGRGRRVVINTIAFGDPSSQAQLKRIAEESGGTYRFVPVGGP
jgi:hypothetical protein